MLKYEDAIEFPIPHHIFPATYVTYTWACFHSDLFPFTHTSLRLCPVYN